MCGLRPIQNENEKLVQYFGIFLNIQSETLVCLKYPYVFGTLIVRKCSHFCKRIEFYYVTFANFAAFVISNYHISWSTGLHGL